MFSHSKKIELFTSKYKNNWYLFINFYFQFSGKEKKIIGESADLHFGSIDF